MNSEPRSGGTTTRETVLKAIPSLAFTDENTSFTMYRQDSVDREASLYTVFYVEPGNHKMRIDGIVDLTTADPEAGGIGPKELRILQWGEATRALDSRVAPVIPYR